MLSGSRSYLSGLIWDICKWLALPLLIYWFVAHLHLDVPGIYEDAVDPDYLIVKLLNPSSPAPFPDLPGNFVLQKFPVLAQGLSRRFAVLSRTARLRGLRDRRAGDPSDQHLFWIDGVDRCRSVPEGL